MKLYEEIIFYILIYLLIYFNGIKSKSGIFFSTILVALLNSIPRFKGKRFNKK